MNDLATQISPRRAIKVVSVKEQHSMKEVLDERRARRPALECRLKEVGAGSYGLGRATDRGSGVICGEMFCLGFYGEKALRPDAAKAY